MEPRILLHLLLLAFCQPTAAFSISRSRCASSLTPQKYRESLPNLRPVDRTSTTVLYSSQSNDNQLPWDKPALAAVDFASLLVFAGVGKASHSADGSIDLALVFQVAAPFLASWFLLSPLTGVYNDLSESSVGNSVKQTAKGWILAVPLGCVFRGVIKGYVPPAPFVIVTMIATLVILGSTRALYTVAEDQLER